MARLTRRATVLLGCSLILAFVTACGIGSDPKPADRKHRVRLRYNNTGAAAPSDSLLPGGTYRTPELTRKQLIATAVKAGFTRTRAEQSLARERINQTATFTLTLERWQWTQSFSYDRIREGSVSRQRTRSSTRTQSWLPNPEGGETVFEYALEGDAIRISFKNVDPQQLCQHDAKCAGGVLVWQSAPFSRWV